MNIKKRGSVIKRLNITNKTPQKTSNLSIIEQLDNLIAAITDDDNDLIVSLLKKYNINVLENIIVHLEELGTNTYNEFFVYPLNKSKNEYIVNLTLEIITRGADRCLATIPKKHLSAWIARQINNEYFQAAVINSISHGYIGVIDILSEQQNKLINSFRLNVPLPKDLIAVFPSKNRKATSNFNLCEIAIAYEKPRIFHILFNNGNHIPPRADGWYMVAKMSILRGRPFSDEIIPWIQASLSLRQLGLLIKLAQKYNNDTAISALEHALLAKDSIHFKKSPQPIKKI